MKYRKKVVACFLAVTMLVTNADVVSAAQSGQSSEEAAIEAVSGGDISLGDVPGSGTENTQDGTDVSSGDVPEHDATSDYNTEVKVFHSGEMEGIIWQITDDGVLTISGEYVEDEMSYFSDWPWLEYRDEFTKAVVTAKGVTSTRGWFYLCEKLQEVDLSNFDTSEVADMEEMFSGCSNLTELDLSGFDTSNVVDMAGMFTLCWNLKKLDVSNFDTSNVTNMDEMFLCCNNITELDLSSFDFTSCNNVEDMFEDCPKLEKMKVPTGVEIGIRLPFVVMYDSNGIPYRQMPLRLEEPIWIYRHTDTAKYVIASGELSGLLWKITSDGVLAISGTNTDMETTNRDTYPWHEYWQYFSKVEVTAENVISTCGWFKDCIYIREADLSKFDSSMVTNMSYMFAGCGDMEELDIGHFNTSKVTDMNHMFSWCHWLTRLDLSNFDTSNVTNMSYMFYSCQDLTEVNIRNFNTSKVTDMSEMFAYCNDLEELDISSFDFGVCDDTTRMFHYCESINRLHLPAQVWVDVMLPLDIMYDLNGVAYGQIPKGLLESIWLYKEVPNEFGNLRVTDVKPQTYTGKAIKPQIQVYDGNTLLIEKKDYTLSYKNNTKVCDSMDAKKMPTIVVKGKGNYTKSETITFEIVAKNVADEDVTVNELVAVEGRKVQKPIPVLKYNGKKLVNKRDFTVSYPDLEDETKVDAYKLPGTYRVLVTGKGNFTGTRELTFTITGGTLMSKTKIAKITNQTYTGAAIEPEIKVTKGKTELVKGRDYTVSYENNVEIGKATVVVSGMGEYAGTKTATFQIVGQPITKAKVEGIVDKTYNGTEQGQDVTVMLTQKVQMENGMQEVPVKLENGTDYEVTYAKNVNAGTATIIISGKGHYSGTIKKKFKIQPYDLQQDEDKLLSGVPENLVVSYEKGGCKPVLNLSFAGTAMVAKTDYTISYQNNTKVADLSASKVPTIVVKGKRNFKGTVTVPFSIKQKDFQDRQNPIVTKVADVAYSKSKGKFMSKPVLTDVNGKKLVAGKDYEKKITYTSEEGMNLDKTSVVEAGKTVRVTITGKGAYTGTIEATYRVTQASFKNAKIKIEPQAYTGRGIILTKEDISVTMKGEKLVYGEDYLIVQDSYKNNVKKGNASVTIKGMGNYGGEKNVKFKIVPKEFIWFWRLIQ